MSNGDHHHGKAKGYDIREKRGRGFATLKNLTAEEIKRFSMYVKPKRLNQWIKAHGGKSAKGKYSAVRAVSGGFKSTGRSDPQISGVLRRIRVTFVSMPPKNHGKPWHTAELARLETLLSQGHPVPAIAQRLARSEGAVRRKALALKPAFRRRRRPSQRSRTRKK